MKQHENSSSLYSFVSAGSTIYTFCQWNSLHKRHILRYGTVSIIMKAVLFSVWILSRISKYELIGCLSLDRQQATAILLWIRQPSTGAPVCNILQHNIHWDSSQRLLKAQHSNSSSDLYTLEMFYSFKAYCCHCKRRGPGKHCHWHYGVKAMKGLQMFTITGLVVLYCWSFFSNNVPWQK